MNKVTLYQTTKSEHLTCGDQIELCQFNYDEITPIRASGGEFIIDQKVKKLQYPVQKYVFSQQDWKGNVEERIVYVAFDDELLELIQCERSKFQSLNDEIKHLLEGERILRAENKSLTNEVHVIAGENISLENECLQLKTKLSKIVQMNWWKRIVFIFKGCE